MLEEDLERLSGSLELGTTCVSCTVVPDTEARCSLRQFAN